MRLAHLSDVHFGRIVHPQVVDALVETVEEYDVDLTIVSGDLTQRARSSQYRAARAFLDRFTSPLLVLPGNHDVAAWYNPLGRMVRPLRRYKRYISKEVSPTFEAERLAVFGLNSAHGWTIKGGRIRRDDLKRMRAFFDEQPDDQFRVLTLHHHLFLIEALMPHDISRRAEAALETAAACEVDLVLCGHLHQSHVHQTVVGDHPLVIASAGTATSNRGRRQDRETNYFNLIRVEPRAFTIEEHRFEEGRFLIERETTFTRARSGSARSGSTDVEPPPPEIGGGSGWG